MFHEDDDNKDFNYYFKLKMRVMRMRIMMNFNDYFEVIDDGEQDDDSDDHFEVNNDGYDEDNNDEF